MSGDPLALAARYVAELRAGDIVAATEIHRQVRSGRCRMDAFVVALGILAASFAAELHGEQVQPELDGLALDAAFFAEHEAEGEA
ncbi:Uncharacterised protein [Mycobacteroides abscessus subsp. abscessus]|uniref:hypothetical protein n=1 Tax=Mycobacteroides abscessus TaxID=36809 RepID=UPI0009A82004|nr:hypothetical protein [Mycobacteroides abscessus]SKD91940.1 Uncharacterised protein [Mycobacteroides abscessus subsp. abscessus]